MPGQALCIFSILGLFFLCALFPQENAHAEGAGHVKTHFPIMEIRLAAEKFKLEQPGNLPDVNVAFDPLLEQINPDGSGQT